MNNTLLISLITALTTFIAFRLGYTMGKLHENIRILNLFGNQVIKNMDKNSTDAVAEIKKLLANIALFIKQL